MVVILDTCRRKLTDIGDGVSMLVLGCPAHPNKIINQRKEDAHTTQYK